MWSILTSNYILSFVRVAYNACTAGGCALSPLSPPLLTGDSVIVKGVMYPWYLIVDEAPIVPEEESSNVGLIVGIVGGVVGGIVVVLIIIIIVWYCRRRSKQQQYQM